MVVLAAAVLGWGVPNEEEEEEEEDVGAVKTAEEVVAEAADMSAVVPAEMAAVAGWDLEVDKVRRAGLEA